MDGAPPRTAPLDLATGSGDIPRLAVDYARKVDAAVAVGYALAVTHPCCGNLGGGGFMIIHSAGRHEDVAIDYRETAPAATTPDIFLGADGKPDIVKSRDSGT